MFFESLFEYPMTHWIIFEYLNRRRCTDVEWRKLERAKARGVT